MANIKLIKALSYTNGAITATKKRPVVEVPDTEVQHYVETGFFAATDDEAKKAEPDEGQEGELFFGGEDPKLTAEENLLDELEKKSVKDLKAYAAKNGIDLAEASKKRRSCFKISAS